MTCKFCKKIAISVFFTAFFALFTLFANAQDTIKLMEYNLMYYTNTSGVSGCNSQTNNIDSKDVNIRTIFHHVKPTVFCVCELGSQNSYADRLLENAINTNGVDYYKRGPLTSLSGGYIANMIYYDSRKLTFYKNYTVTTSYRDINGYQMYYNSHDLANGDTVFITFWVGHLKAGSYDSDRNSRKTQAERLMAKIEQLGLPGNYILCGDLNFYSSDEDGYKELVEYSNSLYKFYDPINRPGHWHSNYSFADLHTQSTHNQDDDCFSSGGLDDRFDIILVSPYIYYGSDRVHIIEGSYRTLGQDGNRFNSTVVSPANNSVPADVATALYNQSDHLPVIMDMLVDVTAGIPEYQAKFFANVVNPVENSLKIEIQNEEEGVFFIGLYSVDGRILMHRSERLEQGFHRLEYAAELKSGMYLLVIDDGKGHKIARKIIK